MLNLIENALVYSQKKSPVRVEVEGQLEKRGMMIGNKIIKIRVKDDGVGIPEDNLPHVFDKFYRVGANKRQAKGTGLGLNLVKQIVEKVHEGRVFVSSEVNVGSTFCFELPLARSEAVAVSS